MEARSGLYQRDCPLPGITLVANTVYHEHYQTMSMKHTLNLRPDELNVEYKWKKQRWHSLGITTEASPLEMSKGSEQMFLQINIGDIQN